MTITLERVPLQVGQQFLLGVNFDSRREWHNGRVLSREGARLLVECPPESSPALRESVNSDVIIDTWRVMDARYTLRARVTAVQLDRRPQIEVELLEGTRVQHREYFRVPVSLDPREAWVESTNEDLPDKRIRLHLRDLSAGGIRGRCNQMLHVTDTIRFQLILPDGGVPLTLRARVVRVVDEPSPTAWPCEVGAAFVNAPSGTREEIIRFALRAQAADLKRGAFKLCQA